MFLRDIEVKHWLKWVKQFSDSQVQGNASKCHPPASTGEPVKMKVRVT